MGTTEIIITCTATGDIIYEGEAWGATDALVNYYCDNATPAEIYDACCEYGDAIASGDDVSAYEAYLACEYATC